MSDQVKMKAEGPEKKLLAYASGQGHKMHCPGCKICCAALSCECVSAADVAAQL